MPIDTDKALFKLYRSISQGMRKLAKSSVQHVRDAAPVGSARTGDKHAGGLKRSIHEEDLGDGGFKIVAGSDHAIYVEYGTVIQSPRPFMRPEFNRLRSHGLSELAGYIKQAMGG